MNPVSLRVISGWTARPILYLDDEADFCDWDGTVWNLEIRAGQWQKEKKNPPGQKDGANINFSSQEVKSLCA